jgi:hypothetical protein
MLRVKADTEAAAARDEASLQQAAAAAAAARLKARREEEAAAAAAAQLDAAERVKRRLAKQAADRARQHTEKLDAQVAAAKQEAEAAWESEERVRALSQTPQVALLTVFLSLLAPSATLYHDCPVMVHTRGGCEASS